MFPTLYAAIIAMNVGNRNSIRNNGHIQSKSFALHDSRKHKNLHDSLSSSRVPPAASSSLSTSPSSASEIKGNNSSKLQPRRTDHTYHDYSNLVLGDNFKKGKKADSNFPAKLHKILSNSAVSHIICWMPHGRAWKIHNRELLTNEVIPEFFMQKKYESFTRQLNGWGFKRLHQRGPDYKAFYHECFLRGLPHLTWLMKRVDPKQGRLMPDVEGEPNFYEIAQKYPLQLQPPHPLPTSKPVGQIAKVHTQETSNYEESANVAGLGMPSNHPQPIYQVTKNHDDQGTTIPYHRPQPFYQMTKKHDDKGTGSIGYNCHCGATDHYLPNEIDNDSLQGSCYNQNWSLNQLHYLRSQPSPPQSHYPFSLGSMPQASYSHHDEHCKNHHHCHTHANMPDPHPQFYYPTDIHHAEYDTSTIQRKWHYPNVLELHPNQSPRP